MRNIFSLISLLFVFYSLSAQEGAPLLTHFKESREIENQNWAICQDTDRVMFFANRKGILSFDGHDWLSVRIPVIPYSMQTNPTNGKVFIGGEDNFGFLDKDKKGVYEYMPLSAGSLDIGVITRIVFDDSLVWFYGERSVNRYNLKVSKLELSLKSDDNYPFTGMIITPSNTFINVMKKGLFRLESDTLFPIVTGYLTEDVEILFSLPYNNSLVLVGLSDGRLLLFDGIKYYNYQIKDNGYLRDNLLSEGIVIGDSLYAFSTLDGGALVVEKRKGTVLFTINNQNELPDDEIFAMNTDNSGGLWLSHQYGLTRADLNLPVSNYSIYPGLKGNLTSSLEYNKELYVATSEGVFYLTEVENHREPELFAKDEKGKTEAMFQSLVKLEDSQERSTSRKNIFTRIFGKKTARQKTTGYPSVEEIPVKQITKTTNEQYSQKKVSKLKSGSYIYKKVEGLNEKCRQLVPTKNGILAATNKGLFVISNHKAIALTGSRYINSINWNPVDGKYFIAADDGYFAIKYFGGKWSVEMSDKDFLNPVYSIIQTDKKTLWLGGDNLMFRAEINDGAEKIKYKSYSIKYDFPLRYMLNLINDTIYLFAESEIHFFDKVKDCFTLYKPGRKISSPDISYGYPLSNLRLIRLDGEWTCPDSAEKVTAKELSLLKLFDDIVSVNVDEDHIWLINGENKVIGIDRRKYSKANPEINIFIKNIFNGNGTRFSLSDIEFERGDNVIVFNIVAPGYMKKNTTRYQYKINKIMSDWSPWSVKTNYEKAIPGPGEYVLQVRAKDLWGNIGDPLSVKFKMRAPFTRTIFFYVLMGLIILIIVILIIRFREKQLHIKNRILEEKVRERTAKIEAQKEEITSSIEYASRIQMAMISEDDVFRNLFSEHFIFFRPRNIVSGDFYWIGEDEKQIYFTVADCTGHGVPGAFMSTLGISTLNEIIKNNGNLHANVILNLLREKIKTSLHQTGKDGETKDGMDISFCILDKCRKTLQYSGAFNPLFLFHNEELSEYKGDRMPIGIYCGEKASFTNYEINVKKGDSIYLFSDGLIDQFGGPDGTKYKRTNLKKLLISIHSKPMSEQRNIMEDEFDKWKGKAEQIDDVTIIGIRI